LGGSLALIKVTLDDLLNAILPGFELALILGYDFGELRCGLQIRDLLEGEADFHISSIVTELL
jgi:hypothetical protein